MATDDCIRVKFSVVSNLMLSKNDNARVTLIVDSLLNLFVAIVMTVILLVMSLRCVAAVAVFAAN